MAHAGAALNGCGFALVYQALGVDNVARQCVVAAGLPISVAGQSVDRQSSSGLMSISMGAKQIIADGMQTLVAGGLESISLVQNAHMNAYRQADPIVLKRAVAAHNSVCCVNIGILCRPPYRGRDAYDPIRDRFSGLLPVSSSGLSGTGGVGSETSGGCSPPAAARSSVAWSR